MTLSNNIKIQTILREKITKTKNIDQLVEYYIKASKSRMKQDLDEFLADLEVFVYNNYSKIETRLLLDTTIDKLKELKIAYDSKVVESLYTNIAIAENKNLKTGFVFDKVDLDSIKAMRQSFYWVNDKYNQKTQKKLKSIIEDVFRSDLNRSEVAKRLNLEFSNIEKQSKDYFEGVADHIINQSQNIARINQALKYGVEHFKVVARVDGKTSDVCRFMNGRIISASHLKTQVNNIIGAKSQNAKKESASWLNKPILSNKLPKNVGTPPFHFRCRTIIVPVWLKQEKIGEQVNVYNEKDPNKFLTHIDKTGVERAISKRVGKKIYNKGGRGIHKEFAIYNLNNITEIAPHSENKNGLSAKTKTGYYISFKNNEVMTMFKPDEGIESYYTRFSILKDKQIMKKKNLSRKKQKQQERYKVNADKYRIMMLDVETGVEWDICEKGFEEFKTSPIVKGYNFGMSSLTKDDKIAHLFCIGMDEKRIEEVKSDKRFHEVCYFVCTNSDKDWEKREIVGHFYGTFIDAFEYIREKIKGEPASDD